MFVLVVQLLLLPVGGGAAPRAQRPPDRGLDCASGRKLETDARTAVPRAGETSGHANGKKTDARTATTRRGHHPCGGATVILFQKNKLTAGGRGPTPSRRELFQKNKLTLSTNS